MKALLLLFLFMSSLLSAKDPLRDFRWKNRILLVSASSEVFPNNARQELNSLLKTEADQLKERDLILIDISPEKLALRGAIRLPENERRVLCEKLNLEEAKAPVFLLLGKDGGEKARQSPQLDLAKLLALIDTMPMRRSEMNRQQR